MSKKVEDLELGVKETLEVMDAAFDATVVLVKHLRDGLQLGKDGLAIFNELVLNTEYQRKVLIAYHGASVVPAEVGDLNVKELNQIIDRCQKLAEDIVDVLADREGETDGSENAEPEASEES